MSHVASTCMRLWLLSPLRPEALARPLCSITRCSARVWAAHSPTMCFDSKNGALPQSAVEAAHPVYQPYRLTGEAAERDWVQHLELDSARATAETDAGEPLKVMVLYGSLRQKSYSRLLAYEFGRILERLWAEVRVYNPQGMPMKDDAAASHPKVLEIRQLSIWSEAQVWVCPEQHGTITGVFKNQIDWIPLSLGSVNGGSQSFNVVSVLRNLGRWMFTIPNQSSVPKAWSEFDEDGRMKPSNLRDRVVDVSEELLKFGLLLRGHADFLVDRYSEREEKRRNGRPLSQCFKYVVVG